MRSLTQRSIYHTLFMTLNPNERYPSVSHLSRPYIPAPEQVKALPIDRRYPPVRAMFKGAGLHLRKLNAPL